MMRNSNPSVFTHSFSRVPQASMPRTTFKRVLTNKTTIDVDYIYPILNDEILPGDTYSAKLAVLGRLTTPLVPFMDNLVLKVEAFYTPLRLTQDNWVRLQGERDNPDDSIDFARPYIMSPASTGFDEQSLFDYFGFPTKVPDYRVDGSLHREYNKIFNDYYRDQNWQDKLVVDTDDGPDDPADYVLVKRNKPHDYFTSCLPQPQKGDPVDLPLGTSAPIVSNSQPIELSAAGFTDRTLVTNGGGDLQPQGTGTTSASNIIFGGETGLEADLSAAIAPTIYDLYEAFALQELLQIDARGGTRYFEILRSHFGVTSPDSRLQRPEYLGGVTVPININPVAQTSETGSTPLGDLAAVGEVLGKLSFYKSFVEHGNILIMASIVSDLTYQQGLHRSHSRRTRYDFFMPALANLGEQPVLTKELYTCGSLASTDDDVFGYQERWSEYRMGKNLITGLMRSNAAQSLDAYHLSEYFGDPASDSAPAFEDVLPCNTPIDRVLAVSDEPDIRLDAYMVVNHTRVMPTYSVPMLNNRF